MVGYRGNIGLTHKTYNVEAAQHQLRCFFEKLSVFKIKDTFFNVLLKLDGDNNTEFRIRFLVVSESKYHFFISECHGNLHSPLEIVSLLWNDICVDNDTKL